MWNFYTMISVNYRNKKKYDKYILVYIQVKIAETTEYD